DLVLRVPRVEDDGEDRLERLAPEGPLRPLSRTNQEEVLDELLRQRRAALQAALAHVGDGGADKPPDRDARGPGEVAVPRHEHGVLEALRQVLQPHERAVLELVSEDRPEPLRLDDERGQLAARGVADGNDLPPSELDLRREALEVLAGIPEVAGED